jgi:hypothetical protein
MKKVNSNAILKIISTILSLCVLAAIILIARKPSTGYELSIYGAISPVVWVLLITGIAGGIGIVVYDVLNKEEERRDQWQIGLLLILLSNLIIVLLPFLRGYAFSAIDDHLTHLGYLKSILQAGNFAANNVYPPTHILIAQLSSILNVSPEKMINFAGPLFYVLFVLSTYLLSNEILPKSAAILATAASTVLFCYYYIEVFPMGFAFMFFPLVFYLYFKYQRRRYPSLGIPLLTLIGLIVLFHMVAAFVLTVALLIMELGKPIFDRLYISKREQARSSLSRAQPVSLSLFLVSLISLTLWVWNHYGIWESQVRNVVRWFHLELLVEPMTKAAAESFRTLGLSFSGQLELFIKMYGHFFIYAVLCLIPIVMIVRKRIFSGNADVKSIFLFSCLFSVTGALALTDIARPLTGLNAGRIMWAVIALFPPLVGLALYKIGGIDPDEKELIKKPPRQPHRLKFRRAITIWLTITVCSLIGIFSIYPSPFTLQPNLGATHMDTSGEYWLLEQGNPEVKVIGVGYVSTSRFASALWGIQEQNYPHWYGFAPKHFNYTEYQTFGKSLAEDRYMTIDKAGELAYLELYPQIDKFTNSDFARLQRDSTVDKLYANGEMEIWYVHGQAPGGKQTMA